MDSGGVLNSEISFFISLMNDGEHSSVDTVFIYSEPSEQDRSENIRFREGRIDKQLPHG
jgi:hypothetical protein